jgi:hypothetical protein
MSYHLDFSNIPRSRHPYSSASQYHRDGCRHFSPVADSVDGKEERYARNFIINIYLNVKRQTAALYINM